MDNTENQNKNQQPQGDKNKKVQMIVILVIAAIITVFGATIMSSLMENATSKEISYDEFIRMVENGEVKSVEFDSKGKIIIVPKKSENDFIEITYWTTQLTDLRLIEKLEEAGDIKFYGKQNDSTDGILMLLLEYFLPFLIISGFMLLIYRSISKSGGGIMGVGKSNAKVYVEKETGVTFADVAGQEEAKDSLKEIVDFLHNPGRYAKIGAKLPKEHFL